MIAKISATLGILTHMKTKHNLKALENLNKTVFVDTLSRPIMDDVIVDDMAGC